MESINFLAVGAAALSSFLVGGLWYSTSAFGRAWQRENQDPRGSDDKHPARVFGTSLLFALLAAAIYAVVIPPAISATGAALQGLAVGLGMVGASFGINYQFAGRSFRLWLIDAGYHAVQFCLYGLIIGMWR